MQWLVRNLKQQRTLGEYLKDVREERGLTPSHIVRAHNFPKKFLEALERGDYGALPEAVYTKALLKKYLSILNLPCNEGVARFEEEYTHWKNLTGDTRQQSGARVRKSVSGIELGPLFWRRSFVLVLGVTVLVYLGFRVDAAVAPTALTVVSPPPQMKTTDRTVVISGVAEPEATVTINGEPVSVDEFGTYEEEVSLNDGMNTLEVTASKKYRPPTIVIRHVLVLDSEGS
jgi:cytoskeletal protein RodZ